MNSCTSSLSHTCHGCLRNDSVTQHNPSATERTCRFCPEYQGQHLASYGKGAREKEREWSGGPGGGANRSVRGRTPLACGLACKALRQRCDWHAHRGLQGCVMQGRHAVVVDAVDVSNRQPCRQRVTRLQQRAAVHLTMCAADVALDEV